MSTTRGGERVKKSVNGKNPALHYDIKENHLRALLKSRHPVHRDEADFLHPATFQLIDNLHSSVFSLALLYQSHKISSCKYLK